jgi:hypothetical protein
MKISINDLTPELDQIHDQVSNQGYYRAREQVSYKARGQVFDQINDRVGNRVWLQVRDRARDQMQQFK